MRGGAAWRHLPALPAIGDGFNWLAIGDGGYWLVGGSPFAVARHWGRVQLAHSRLTTSSIDSCRANAALFLGVLQRLDVRICFFM